MKRKYTKAKYLAFCYVIFIILSVFMSKTANFAISTIAQLSILPYLYIKLKQLIEENYGKNKVSLFFVIIAFLFIVPTILLFSIRSDSKYMMQIFRTVYGLISIRGLFFIIIGFLLIKKNYANNLQYKILVITMILFGTITLITGIISAVPIILAIMPRNIGYMYLMIFGWGKEIVQIALYGVMGNLFKTNGINKMYEVLNEQ